MDNYLKGHIEFMHTQTVFLSYNEIQSGNIHIDISTFEFFKNGLLMNQGPSNDYTIITVEDNPHRIILSK